MHDKTRPGQEAIEIKGWWRAHQWLLLRRLSQAMILLLFLSGPWWGIWIFKGNLSASLLLDTVPMTDPYLLLQILLTQHLPEMLGGVGAVLVLGFYLLVGGRMYCSWVCPLNVVTDSAAWLRNRLDLKSSWRLSRSIRYWLLGLTLLLTLLTGTLVWESLNPVSLLHRGVLFGMGIGWLVILGIFLFDVLIMRHGWCGHLCPVGAFYSLLGRVTPLRISTTQRAACNDCLDCFRVCPEPQVITAALKDKQHQPLIDESQCTNCGRCIDVCSQDVFALSLKKTSQIDN